MRLCSDGECDYEECHELDDPRFIENQIIDANDDDDSLDFSERYY